jgi:hypothetical protein
MHDTARCLGYPSDSSRAARERARETSCWRHPCRAGQARPGRTLPPSALAHGQCGFSTGQCGLAHCACGLPLSTLPARVACLHHLAGVGHCSLAIGHGCTVGLPLGVLDRQPVSPLPSTSACSGAGSGWHGCWWISFSASPRRAGQARPGQILPPLPSLLACAASTLACAASLFARVACLSHLAGVGHCSLAIDHGCSVELAPSVVSRDIGGSAGPRA